MSIKRTDADFDAAVKGWYESKKQVERLKSDLLTVAESKASIRAEGMERAAVIADKYPLMGSDQIAAAIRAKGKS